MPLGRVFRVSELYVISQPINRGDSLLYHVFIKRYDKILTFELFIIFAFSYFLCSWLMNLESTKWFQYLGALIRTALLVCDSIKSARSVLIHCSDGWDRTSQIVSLAEIMLDPYYRTIEV